MRRLVLIASVGPRRTPYAAQYGRELFSRLGEAEREALSRQRSAVCSGTAESVRYGITSTSPRVLASLGDWDLRPELARVRAPTLVIHGEQDLFPLEGVREWAASILAAERPQSRPAAHPR